MNGPLQDDIIMAEGMIAGSEALWMAVTQAQLGRVHKTSDRLIWRAGTGFNGERGDSKWQAAAYRGFLNQQARNAEIETMRVSRDPCPYCAVRADIGCKHRRIA